MKESQFNKIDLICHSCGCNLKTTDLKASVLYQSTYKLFYIFNGTCTVTVDGKKYILDTYCSLLVFPYQSYLIESSENLKFFWIEFSGIESTAMISQTAFRLSSPVVGKLNFRGFEYMFEYPDCKADAVFDKYRNGAAIILILSYYLEHFPYAGKRKNSYVTDARTFIEENYHNPDFSVKKIVEHLKIDRSHFYKLFKNETGLSPVDYITQLRISQAEILLVNDRMAIKDISYAVGFSDPLYFSRVFKRLNGKTPSEFRKNIFQKKY